MEIKTRSTEITLKKGKVVEKPNTENLTETKGFATRFPKVKDRVLSILKNDEYARRNYLWLCLRYWAKCGHIKIVVPMEKFEHVNSPETITRAARKLVEEAKTNQKLKFLLKDKETISMRNKRQEEISTYFSIDNSQKRARYIK